LHRAVRQPLPPLSFAPDESTADADADAFENGPLKTVFDKAYGSEGGAPKKIVWGVFKQEVDAAALPTASESAARREAAAAALTNIDDEERERRRLAGYAFGAGVAVLAVALPALDIPLPNRFAAELFPVFLAFGFTRSADAGL